MVSWVVVVASGINDFVVYCFEFADQVIFCHISGIAAPRLHHLTAVLYSTK